MPFFNFSSRNMASHSLLFLAVVFSFICSGALEEKLIRVECQPAVGVVGQTMKIHCSFISSIKEVNIDLVYIFKSDPENPVFLLKNNIKTGDLRFNLPSENNPSLELASAAVADEGNYRYMILTNCGVIEDGSFRIGVTSKYSQPTTNSMPDVIQDGGNADLYCNASGGYPAGSIQWFDSTNTDWTKSATLEITEGEDKLVQLSSKLTFSKIDSSWAPFRCVVLNNKFVKEGEIEFQPKIKEGKPNEIKFDFEKLTSTNVVAPVVVIGSLLVGLLLLIVLRGQCNCQSRRPSTIPFLSHSSDLTYAAPEEPDVEKALCSVKPKGEATQLKTQRPED
ncbi:hypothetical protein AMEX_G7391 [Astyanax mexicanus]|uniref:Ig-like domain-containing protein n=2 Tax=Astyanax mexicanus TaxID=7994 RepID=A0A8T2M6Z7_ASTMX|nr:hypothetical protein AMEX_G7391 [Astyanax mexicanus]